MNTTRENQRSGTRRRGKMEKRSATSIIDETEQSIVPSIVTASPCRKTKLITTDLTGESPRKKSYIPRSISHDDSPNDTLNSNYDGPHDSSDAPLPMMTKTAANMGTPTRRRGRNDLSSRIVTPSTNELRPESPFTGKGSGASNVCRNLVMPPIDEAPNNIVEDEIIDDNDTKPSSKVQKESNTASKKKKRQAFIRSDSNVITTQSNTRNVYAIVNKLTGKIGGNGHGGAIYGELTIGSMQKMINLMKIHTGFDEHSRFIDVGSGLGKPNLHVAQDPSVEFSFGIEMEHVRWMLSMSNLNRVLEEAVTTQAGGVHSDDQVKHRCVFQHGDITDANTFDPFTHVYMFDIGFPPALFKKLAQMFNRSQSEYLICYHAPYLIKDRYGFKVELLVQTSTSMHGSSENHMGYIYRRATKAPARSRTTVLLEHNDTPKGIPCDPLFVSAWNSTRQEASELFDEVHQRLESNLSSQRPRRIRKPVKRLNGGV